MVNQQVRDEARGEAVVAAEPDEVFICVSCQDAVEADPYVALQVFCEGPRQVLSEGWKAGNISQVRPLAGRALPTSEAIFFHIESRNPDISARVFENAERLRAGQSVSSRVCGECGRRRGIGKILQRR